MIARTVSLARFLAGVPSFVRTPVIADDAERTIRDELDRREERFLHLVERAVYGYSRSPYRKLLELAGCELGDMKALVSREGMEVALKELRRAGVYVTFEESKGRVPIVRGGRTIDARPEDFDNPLLGGAVRRTTGGTTGPAVTHNLSLEDLSEKASAHLVCYGAHELTGAPTASLREGFSGLGVTLVDGKVGNPHERWFSPDAGTGPARRRYARAVIRAVAVASRVGGVPFAMPEEIGYEDFGRVARWASDRLREAGASVVRTNASHALRVCAAAEEAGVDLRGVVFMGGGDPATPGKVSRIKETGAGWVPVYVMTETGRIGAGCAQPADGSDVHLMDHIIAVITHPRTVPGTDLEVDAFNFTSLRRYSPKIMLNTESDDYGVIEERSCGCPLEALGLRHHIREIFSYRKLTTGGVTLVGSSMLRVLEEVLPRRFGGSALDYQLVEEEDDRGFTRLSLVVSPRIEVGDEAELIGTVMDELGDDRLSASVRAIWTQLGTMRVMRREPEATGRGKIVPLASERRWDR